MSQRLLADTPRVSVPALESCAHVVSVVAVGCGASGEGRLDDVCMSSCQWRTRVGAGAWVEASTSTVLLEGRPMLVVVRGGLVWCSCCPGNALSVCTWLICGNWASWDQPSTVLLLRLC